MEHNKYMIKMLERTKRLYAELENEGYGQLDIQMIGMLISDCSRSLHTIKLTETRLKRTNAIH